MKALVTGATGMIGGAVVDALRARGHRIRALVRPSAQVDALLRQGVDVVMGDLGDEASLRQAVQGIDLVFHAAALLGFRNTAQALDDVNVAGTERLLTASRAAGVQRFIHISSVGVYGPHEPPIHEDTPQTPNNAYGRSKQRAEEAVWRAHAQGLATIILRPCIVYGPGDRYFTPIFTQLMRLPVLPLPDGGDRLIELVYVSDVAEAAMQAATRSVAIGQAYNITDGRPTTISDLIETYTMLTGQGPRIINVSVERLTQSAGVLRDALAPIAPRVAYVLRPETLANLQHDIHYDLGKAQRELGYSPQVGFYEGLRRTLEAQQPQVLRQSRVSNMPMVVAGSVVLGGLIGVALLRRAIRQRPQK